ncbi:ferredoxin--NADP+ reductase [Motilibacter peucedani]|uniref:ferredoxin--NADP(+) reductase n=1 Tax=Motilibacter peucedani TaxID=598650 RepID=A0A420XK16_9ACTN|nr:FAD-dependent oxidoreductase [Motilibacter peucedani]RKS67966.1 ferredoxin--NADP+ reductase [Motilibacter peucedani]
MLRVAVVGSGPAGIYAAESLVAHGPAQVDVYDRVPCPYGLVRYGVAPDHEKIRSISASLAKVFDSPDVRFLGNVEVGTDITLEELGARYDAVLVSSGSSAGRGLGIPGDGLPGSFTATELVSWYCGHPDTRIDAFTDTARHVVVVGMGNVAVDVARILLRPADELARTDVPPHVLDVLRASPIESVSLVGRRGPAEARWTTKELKELGSLTGVDVVVEPAELAVDAAGEQRLAAEPGARRNLDVVREWAQRPRAGASRTLRVRFLQRPVRVLGTERVAGVELERCVLDGHGGATGTGETERVEAGMVVASVGYRGVAVPGLPFDERSGTIPHERGRVVDAAGEPVPGVYVAGWIKRGPSGVIGTNKHDAHETVATLLEDAAAGRLPQPGGTGDALELLASRGVHVVTWSGWRAIEQAELALGESLGRGRTKIVGRDDLVAAALRAAGA